MGGRGYYHGHDRSLNWRAKKIINKKNKKIKSWGGGGHLFPPPPVAPPLYGWVGFLGGQSRQNYHRKRIWEHDVIWGAEIYEFNIKIFRITNNWGQSTMLKVYIAWWVGGTVRFIVLMKAYYTGASHWWSLYFHCRPVYIPCDATNIIFNKTFISRYSWKPCWYIQCTCYSAL